VRISEVDVSWTSHKVLDPSYLEGTREDEGDTRCCRRMAVQADRQNTSHLPISSDFRAVEIGKLVRLLDPKLPTRHQEYTRAQAADNHTPSSPRQRVFTTKSGQ